MLYNLHGYVCLGDDYSMVLKTQQQISPERLPFSELIRQR